MGVMDVCVVLKVVVIEQKSVLKPNKCFTIQN